ncbi:hypothetical protein [Nocardia gipuzkoensis]|uniref:hypothetical protein n=1 Tax=Nocardia gipuzkoensis TaxID=2749991 RepID=UPI0038CDA32A
MMTGAIFLPSIQKTSKGFSRSGTGLAVCYAANTSNRLVVALLQCILGPFSSGLVRFPVRPLAIRKLDTKSDLVTRLRMASLQVGGLALFVNPDDAGWGWVISDPGREN